MPPRRFQITIKDLMIATFWFGVTISAWGLALERGRQYHLLDDYYAYKIFALAALGWSSMFSAIGPCWVVPRRVS